MWLETENTDAAAEEQRSIVEICKRTLLFPRVYAQYAADEIPDGTIEVRLRIGRQFLGFRLMSIANAANFCLPDEPAMGSAEWEFFRALSAFLRSPSQSSLARMLNFEARARLGVQASRWLKISSKRTTLISAIVEGVFKDRLSLDTVDFALVANELLRHWQGMSEEEKEQRSEEHDASAR